MKARVAALALSLLCLFATNQHASAMSTGCAAVNAGQWNLNVPNEASTGSVSGEFRAGDILNVFVGGGGQSLGQHSLFGFSGSLAPNGFGNFAIDEPQNFTITVQTTGTGGLSVFDGPFTSIISCIPAPPVVTGVSPASGPAAGGTVVTITGTSLGGTINVQFGSTFAFPSASTDTSITITAPAGSGTVDLIVATFNSSVTQFSAVNSASTFTYISPPTVTAVSPNSGPTSGGTSVTITGTNFSSASAVKFGANNATSFAVNSATSITATAPAGSAGIVDVTVTTPGGGTSATGVADRFTYISAPTVTGVSPSAGPTAGGTGVNISGSNFTGVTAVKFGSTNATSFTVNSTNSITATAPAGSGTVDVKVTATGGTSATAASDQFTYVVAPTVSGVAPGTGPTPGGTSVTVTGSNFTGATAVRFGATGAPSFSVVSSSLITATSPAGGAGTVDVTVTTTGGTSATSVSDAFTYYGPPTVTSVAANSGPAGGGNFVTVSGTNFTNATAVSFGGTAAATFFVTGATSIRAKVPAHATGAVDVAVTSPAGTGTGTGAYTFVTGPTTTALVASPNPSASGQSVTFTATVAGVAPATGTPTGSATFKEGSTTLGTAALSAGVASFTTSSLSAGAHTITAVYGGDSSFATSTSSGVAQTVNKASATTALTSSLTTAAVGQSVTFTATVAAVAPATGTPTGTVTFTDLSTGAALGTITASAGVAAVSTTTLASGNHTVTATYNGDAKFSSSVSPARTVTVNATGTTVALTSSLNPSNLGQSVTLTATVTAQTGTPTGSVTFKDSATTLGTGTLASGAATLTTSALSAGGHALTASYDGDANFSAATSPALLQTVMLSCADAFAGATALSGANGTATGSTAAATGETGEPNHAGVSTPLNSVWCKWTAPQSGPVTFDTTGSDFDTTLAAYTGTSVDALTQVAANDNISASNMQSRVTFTAVQNVVYSIAIDGAGSATGTYVLNWAQTPPQPVLFSAILPNSRSVMIGTMATAFATLINAGSDTATGCSLALPPGFPAGFFYQKTDTLNAPADAADTPIDIPPGGKQSFVFGVTPTVTLNAAEVAIVFACANASPPPTVSGLNTLTLTASDTPTPDLIAVASTPSNDGIVTVPAGGTGYFAAAAINIGAPGAITATVDDDGAHLPLTVTLCRTDPSNGACTNPAAPAGATTSTLTANEISTYAIFVNANAAVPFDPANNRLFLQLKTADGITRGSTSVAIKTQ